MNSRTKKIWIDTSLELVRKTGVGAYIMTLMKCMDNLGINYTAIENKIPGFLKFKFVLHILWLNTIFYLRTIIQKPDIIIFPNFIMPFIKRKKTKYIVVIHDLCCLRIGENTAYTQTIYNYATNNSIKNADKIITVSETIKSELISVFGVLSERISVVNNAIAEHFILNNVESDILGKYGIEKQKYILSVATLNIRKNLTSLIKAFESIAEKYSDLKLVLVGGMGSENRETLTSHSQIIFTGYIPDNEVPALYKDALLYVFPSLYEGFGTPIIEAQYTNCPIICSDIPVFREVAGDGAEFSDTNFDKIAEKLNILIEDSQLRQDLVEKGKKNVQRFNIEKIEQQLEVLLND